jgi:cell division protein FtsB
MASGNHANPSGRPPGRAADPFEKLSRHWGTAVLAALLAWVQLDLWIGKGNWPEAMRMERALEQAEAGLAASRERNGRVSAEVSDLQEGLEMVEEKARSELGMLRQHEVFVQIAAPR